MLWLKMKPEILLLPVMTESSSTLPFIQKCLAEAPGLQVIAIASREQMNEAAEAMRIGVQDFLFRPFTAERLTKTLAAAILRWGNTTPKISHKGRERKVSPAFSPSAPLASPTHKTTQKPPATAMPDEGSIAGAHPLGKTLHEAVIAVANSQAPVFLTGEVGSGKSYIARAIHRISARPGALFHNIDCAALTPKTLPETLLSITGTATFFLDEICDLSTMAQAHLTRLIGDETLPRVRLISATSFEPEQAIGKGILRRDLYYRLCVTHITVPPLRDRGEDLIEIARQKLVEFSQETGGGLSDFSPEALRLLLAYDWPGNLRQLINVVRNIVVLHSRTAKSSQVETLMLPNEILLGGTSKAAHFAGDEHAMLANIFKGQSLAEIERQVIEVIITAHGNSVTRAAKVLNVAPSTLYRKLQSWKNNKD